MTFVIFFKNRLLFNIVYCFCIFVNKILYIFVVDISNSKRLSNAKPLVSFLCEDKDIARFSYLH